jgi:hypothetical protein
VPVLLRQPKKRLIGGMASPFHRHANGLMPASTPSPGAGISWHVFPRIWSKSAQHPAQHQLQHQHSINPTLPIFPVNRPNPTYRP